jgi:uncharacterized HhH-GPD family protein
MAEVHFPITGNPEDDQVLIESPLALMIGMLLDQQVPMSWAFRGPARLKERLDGRLDAGEIAAMGPDAVAALFSEKPALHRFPGSMGKRTAVLCQHLVDHHHGDAADVWEGAADAADLAARVNALPGFGEEKSMIFIALLAKRFDAAPKGWEAYAGPFADDEPRSVADVDSDQALLDVRAWKKAKKAAGKTKQE